jgi:hypothetical protein
MYCAVLRCAVLCCVDADEENALVQLQNKVFAQLESDAFPQFMLSDSFKTLIISSVCTCAPASASACFCLPFCYVFRVRLGR